MNSVEKNKKTLEYYYKNRERLIKQNKEWKLKNKEKMVLQKKKYYEENKEQILKHKKEYRLSHPEKSKEYRRREDVKRKARERIKIKRKVTNRAYDKLHYQKNRERILAYGKQHSQLPHIKARRNELTRIWRKNNPRSNRSLYLELQDAMNNVRLRDHNTCQWQGCGITYRHARIDVNHIFPRSEYPDLELIEQYMICYCANHHGYWHRMRGDHYSEMIYPSQEYLDANPEQLLTGGDD